MPTTAPDAVVIGVSVRCDPSVQTLAGLEPCLRDAGVMPV